MAYTPPEYPAAIPDEVTDLPDRLDDIDWIEAARYNELKKEIVAIMTELGTDPAGASTDVKTRLALLALIADPTFTGDATIPTIDLTGGQIKFPASPSASADVNTLDDYEEGTFGGSGANGIIQSGNGTITCETDYLCSYTKIGNLVTVVGSVTVSAVSAQSGSMYMGLPFTCGVKSKVGTNIVHVRGVDFTGNYVVITPTAESAYCYFFAVVDDATGDTLNTTGIAVGDVISFGLSFMI